MHANIAGKKVAILVDNYFEQDEFEDPLTALKDAGVIVTVITAGDDLQLYGMRHADIGGKFQADMLLSEADPDDYDGLVLPGGVVNADKLRVNEDAQDWAVDFLDSGRPIAVICHAPWVLVSADAVEGRRLTSYFTIQDDIQNAGGEWVDQAVVVDDNLITSRKPDDLPAFCEALLKMLSQEPPSLRGESYREEAERAADEPLDERSVEDDSRLRSLGYDKDRDQLTLDDERDILEEEDDEDPDELHPSGVVPRDERDDAS